MSSDNVFAIIPRAPTTPRRSEFHKGQEQARRNFIRRAVRSYSGFTKSERDVTLALLNVWFHHKNGPLGYIHPGRRLLARRARVSDPTVKRLLARMRRERVLIVLAHLRGGKHTATQYAVNEERLIEMCGTGWVKQFLRMRGG